MKIIFAVCALTYTISSAAFAEDTSKTVAMRIVIAGGADTSSTKVAVKRLEEYGGVVAEVSYTTGSASEPATSMTVLLGSATDSGQLKQLWSEYPSANPDAYLIKTISTSPTVVAASGSNARGTLYAAYHLADLMRGGANISDLNIFRQPKIDERYVSFGATTHGRRHYRPELHWKTLNELPSFGYNGIIIYPGGGTPIGREASPVAEREDGTLYLDPENTAKLKEWFREIDKYQLDIMMTIPPVIPPGYTNEEIKTYYGGGPEPDGYIEALQSHFRRYLELVTEAYPESDMYMFNSTEGATFGRNVRFFGHPDTKRFSNATYLQNNEKVIRAYFDVLQDFFKDDMDKVSFWTHSFGLTSEGIAKVREILFQYPELTIIEDDFWNNNLWPHDLPSMAYLPESLREKVSTNNPFALFQIAPDGEYYGGGSMPNAYPGSHIRSAQDALKRKARMVIQRLDLHDRTEYGTAFGTVEIIPYAASKQLWEPTPTEPEIWAEWAESRFGKAAAPYVIRALQESKTFIRQGLAGNGINLLGVGSEFAPRLWMKDESGVNRFYLFGKPGRRLVDKDEGDVIYSEEFTAWQMDTHSISIGEFRKNQDEAMAAVERGLQEIEQAKPHLVASDYEMLREIFENGKNVLTAMRLLGEAAYATNIVLDNFDNVENPNAQFAKAVADLEAYLKQEKLIPEMTRNITRILEHYKDIATE